MLWFELVKQWRESGRGSYGITFPFLVGSLSLMNKENITKIYIEKIFDEIIHKPVAGYYSEVRWCGTINEPVVSISKIENISKIAVKDSFKSNNCYSLVFTEDLMSMFHLDSDNAQDCLEKLILRTWETVSNGCFSKNGGQFIPFTKDDLTFINAVKQSVI
ncbi:hypothetical protein ABKU35_000014 [Salmonella enterica]|uniref:Uncharacterized protein n=2 Tax=Salmonella enterica TaxID=28901 RepID=A0A5U7YWG6_SALER|nr:hypothetical protein [Salmonella enterica]EAA5452939.1 hypothetical protein [Salmonella enterica subsp. enterica]EAC0924921.1 hypothetical protein [Salmonella enterica subsp. enterica serovar Lisboa]EBV0551532.1 hypothetical protein [Salmonella enterica subsp. enterica serovar Bron]EFQ4024177.1 hypothetical protein [Salmonella enterica subsp. enterica serovar Agama]HBL9974678.1 hypothetical protein [Salmonella enterica subsp. enterica serovar Marshall]